ncbi:sodium channel and clathrin linker 1 isoform X2 [Patagioenas fasciata]|uniref:sodium channel and clathrin linker 1 isoform X2 n=1 Tax=Patagioenas fasciata TaxID=372321 RepID=UPI003A98F341
MASELAGAAEPDQRPSVALGQYEIHDIFRTTVKQEQASEMRLKFEQVTKENEGLYVELKHAVEDHLESLPFMPLGTDIPGDEQTVRNYQEQLQVMKQENEVAVEVWQKVLQELKQFQEQCQEGTTETQIHMAERQNLKNEVTSLQQLIEKLHTANEKIELSNQQLQKTVTEQNVELEELRKQLRQAITDVQTASTRLDETTKLTEKLQGELERREEDVISAQQRERASDKRLREMQSSIIQLETRLCVALEDAEQLTRERTALEKQIQELQTRYADVEREKYDAVGKVQDCIQLLEDANLQRSQALVAEKQKEEDIKKMKDELAQLAEDTAARIRKEVDMVKKQYDMQISRLTEELSALQMECGEKQGQIERAIREKRAVEEELEKAYKQDRGYESDMRKLEQMHQKYLLAEATKCDLQLTLQTTQNKLKQLEMNYEEEKSRSQEIVSRLESTLASEREKSVFISEDRLKLQQENEQLQREMDGLRKLASEAQRNAKIKISTMEHEYALKESGYEAQLKEMEDTSHKSTAELRRLLLAQQKATIRWKEETKSLTETTEARITKLKCGLTYFAFKYTAFLRSTKEFFKKAKSLFQKPSDFIQRVCETPGAALVH